MNGNTICQTCKKEFYWIRTKYQAIPKFCSMKCRGHTGFRPGGKFHINEATEKEKLKRLSESFEKNVIRREGCWDWKGKIESNGYARMSCSSELGARHAHRASYLIYIGNIPKGKQINHKCNNEKCSNPEHLYLGTQKENRRDTVLIDNQAKGSKNGNSKLDEQKVKEIKVMLKSGEKIKIISEKY